MWIVARRPRWIAALVFALALAAGFAALGQWQLDRSFTSGQVIARDTETVRALDDVTAPQSPVTETVDGQLVRVEGVFEPDSYVILSDRISDGDTGFWAVGRLDTGGQDGAAAAAAATVAVALGWAPTRAAAASAIDGLIARSGDAGPTTVTGRYLPGEAPQLDDFENGELSSLSPPGLVNSWPDVAGDVYGGYIVSAADYPGLTPIDAPAPSSTVAVNWLNVFYAVEWVVFAGFALFMWYRLVRDAWEREMEEAELAAAEREAAEHAESEDSEARAPVN